MVIVMEGVMATAKVGVMVTAMVGVMPMRNILKATTQIWKVCDTMLIFVVVLGF